ncbi:hypothetical protein BCR41DRAFT_344052 [Lobosporangium transversale]|uniref:Uncharacterized protein n=1 Tax=Lobosporangium transversale TaxID=64571 RepID=A0A1Y2H418_9FUNG|nr:hypothetical protein BCR41DRAFT_344052 [Lobosporangium transversale]ORZ28774.1 hypothetical protein BCR41DRAFT_344052 [Lobosporangium transversale]|eukprot:XP_021886447.1 hypothetical protein BCR41DRAFT_344052 [Lobosporangium transversale]
MFSSSSHSSKPTGSTHFGLKTFLKAAATFLVLSQAAMQAQAGACESIRLDIMTDWTSDTQVKPGYIAQFWESPEYRTALSGRLGVYEWSQDRKLMLFVNLKMNDPKKHSYGVVNINLEYKGRPYGFDVPSQTTFNGNGRVDRFDGCVPL